VIGLAILVLALIGLWVVVVRVTRAIRRMVRFGRAVIRAVYAHADRAVAIPPIDDERTLVVPASIRRAKIARRTPSSQSSDASLPPWYE
jgi:hypothetical protein